MSYSPRRLVALVAAGLTAVALAGCTAPTTGGDSDAAPTVALSNAFLGNSWRQSMVASFEEAATQAKADGLISEFTVVNTPGANVATDQIANIESLLLDAPDILLINPAASDALGPVIDKACAAGTIVVVFDSSVDNDCAYIVTNSFSQWATTATENIAEAMGGEGNLLISRGVVGTPPEAEYYAAQQEVLAKYPGITVVGEVTANCSSADAQTAVTGVLPSLPQIDGVAGCGDGLGVAEAFKAAGLPIPAVTFEPSGKALEFWASNDVADGAIAIMSDPGQVVAALFVGIALFDGVEVPRVTIFPSVLIVQDDRDTWLDAVDGDAIATWQWTKDLVDTQIQANIDGTVDSAALPPVPTK